MKIALAVGALFVFALGTVGAFLATIWTGDDRWAQTGVVGVVLTVAAGGVAGAMADAR
ncbi:hypothetical protein Pan2_93 [Pseudanabaena phage Pan2]|nr:hypothetical protein Pan2_93 [Pseudanabaena phage Pan2]